MENLDEALATLINTALAGLDTSVDFLHAEVPEVVTQLLMWNAMRSGIYCATGIILVVLFAAAHRKTCKIILGKMESGGSNDNAFLFVPWIFSLFIYTWPLAMINLTWLQIWIAPKVWLIEYAARLGE